MLKSHQLLSSLNIDFWWRLGGFEEGNWKQFCINFASKIALTENAKKTHPKSQQKARWKWCLLINQIEDNDSRNTWIKKNLDCYNSFPLHSFISAFYKNCWFLSYCLRQYLCYKINFSRQIIFVTFSYWYTKIYILCN